MSLFLQLKNRVCNKNFFLKIEFFLEISSTIFLSIKIKFGKNKVFNNNQVPKYINLPFVLIFILKHLKKVVKNYIIENV